MTSTLLFSCIVQAVSAFNYYDYTTWPEACKNEKQQQSPISLTDDVISTFRNEYELRIDKANKIRVNQTIKKDLDENYFMDFKASSDGEFHSDTAIRAHFPPFPYTTFYLQSIDAHWGSAEHTYPGIATNGSLQAHFIGSDRGEFIIEIPIKFEQDDIPTDLTEDQFPRCPSVEDEIGSEVELDIFSYLFGRTGYQYTGSSTTPDCGSTNWIVLQEPLTVQDLKGDWHGCKEFANLFSHCPPLSTCSIASGNYRKIQDKLVDTEINFLTLTEMFADEADADTATTVPVEPTTVPVEPTTVPVAATTVPVAATTVPVVATTVPVAATTVPVAAATDPVDATTVPVDVTATTQDPLDITNEVPVVPPIVVPEERESTTTSTTTTTPTTVDTSGSYSMFAYSGMICALISMWLL